MPSAKNHMLSVRLGRGQCCKFLHSSPPSPLRFPISHHQVLPTLRHRVSPSPSLVVPSLGSVSPTPGRPQSWFPTFLVLLTFGIVFENKILSMPLPWPPCHFEVVIESVGFGLLICRVEMLSQSTELSSLESASLRTCLTFSQHSEELSAS